MASGNRYVIVPAFQFSPTRGRRCSLTLFSAVWIYLSTWNLLTVFCVFYCTWLYRFMTRPDVKQKSLGGFLDWSLTTISQTDDQSMKDIMVLDGALQSLVNLHPHWSPLNLWRCTHTCVQMFDASVISVRGVIETGGGWLTRADTTGTAHTIPNVVLAGV